MLIDSKAYHMTEVQNSAKLCAQTAYKNCNSSSLGLVQGDLEKANHPESELCQHLIHQAFDEQYFSSSLPQSHFTYIEHWWFPLGLDVHVKGQHGRCQTTDSGYCCSFENQILQQHWV